MPLSPKTEVLNVITIIGAATAVLVAAIRIALAAIALIAALFIIGVVMKQSGNSDGMEAMTGTVRNDDESETYYGKNAGSRKEAKLKMWTYICAGIIAVVCIVMIILQAVL